MLAVAGQAWRRVVGLQARELAPWNRGNVQPLVLDMFATLRRVIVAAQFRGGEPESLCRRNQRTPPGLGERRCVADKSSTLRLERR